MATKKNAARKKTAKTKSSSRKLYSFDTSEKLLARAVEVIPNGVYGHQSPAITVPGSFPYYAVRASGCRYWDADGNEFIDFMCAYGPMVLGHNHAPVDKAAFEQRKQANCTNHPAPVMIELAERLVGLVPFADWAVFAKNGSDLTTWALQVAREQTQRNMVLCARGAYHGVHAWCTPGHGGLIADDRNSIDYFNWNDLDEVESLVKRHDGQVAAIITTPFHHPAFGDAQDPKPGWWAGLRRLCDREGIVLVLDDVRAGFRLDLRGSHHYYDFEPDLSVYCKAIANGYGLSACVGRKDLKAAASRVFLTGSYWNSAVPMAAALATIDELEKTGGIQHMLNMGRRLIEGLKIRAEQHGLQIRLTGPPSIPTMTFANERDYMRMQVFSAEASKRGVFFHPHHNWFLSVAHSEDDIDESLGIADEAFAVVKQQFGS